jgi:glucose-6-phosphate dehydrogenase assembly protein OpcA
MSDVVWSEQRTTPDAIEEAFRQLEHELYIENGGFVPARVLNMVAFVDRQYSGEVANRLRGVGRYHASRLIVLAYERRREHLDARVTISAEADPKPGELALLQEVVVVELGAWHMDDLPTIVDPLVVSDLPTLLWSPHRHPEAVDALSPLAQAALLDSVQDPVWREALDYACTLTEQLYVVDLAWLRSTPWRERIASAFQPPQRRAELDAITKVTIRHHPDSTVSAMLLIGWLASRLCWEVSPLVVHAGSNSEVSGTARAEDADVALRLQAAPEQAVPGLAGFTLQTATDRLLILNRGLGGLDAEEHAPGGETRNWTILGASRGEGGILGEGIRQALLRDPTYTPALRAARAMLPSS